MMPFSLHALAAYGIVAAFVYLGASAAAIVVAAVRMGGRREDTPDAQDALSASRFTIPVSIVLPIQGSRDERVPSSLGTAIQSLLALDYPEYEVVVVAEALTEGDLEALKTEWMLEPKEFFYRQSLGTSAVRRIYRSSRDPRLMFIDKTPAGRADALNCGVNLARFRYIAAMTPDARFDRDALLRAMAAALRDPAHVVATVSHIESSGEHFERLASVRWLMASRLAWRRLPCGLAFDDAVVIWRRDAVLHAGGFAATADPCLDMMIRMQAGHSGLDGHRVMRTSETVGQIAARPPVARSRARVRRYVAAISMLWRYRRLASTGELGPWTMPYFAASEVLTPLVQASAVVVTASGAAAGWFSWPDVALVILGLSLGQALVTNVALLLRGSAPGAPGGRELSRLLLVAPFELILTAPALVTSLISEGIHAGRSESVAIQPS